MSRRQAFVLMAVMLAAVMLAALALAQAQGDKPAVIMAPVGSVQLTAGASKRIGWDFGNPTRIPHQLAHAPLRVADPDGPET